MSRPVAKFINAVTSGYSVNKFSSLFIDDCAVIITDATKVITIYENLIPDFFACFAVIKLLAPLWNY